MTDTAHMIYAASVRQLAGLEAERNALVLANAAKQEQVDGLLEERDALREQAAELQAKFDALQLAEQRAIYGLEETEKLLVKARAIAEKWRRAYIAGEVTP